MQYRSFLILKPDTILNSEMHTSQDLPRWCSVLPPLAPLSGSTGLLPLLPPGSHNIVHQLVMWRWHSVSEDFMRKRIAIRQDASICYITSSNTTSFKWTHFKEAQNPGIKVVSADAAINISLIVIIFIVVKLGEGARGGSSVQCNSPSLHCQLSRLPVIVLIATCRYTTLLLSLLYPL